MPTLLILLACDTTTPQPDSDPVDGCVPSEDAYVHAAPVLEAGCADCHGATPQFGAPYSLVDGYADLIEGAVGERKVDAIVRELVEQTMPPSSAEPLGHTDLDTLVAWASCGEEHAPESDELTVNRGVWEAPAEAPEDAVDLELRVGEQVVELDDIDDYRQFEFTGIVDDTRYIRRIEPVIDESRVLHHITLTRGDFPFLYAWAPGTGAIEFPNGGMRVDSDDRFVLEVHYNNGAGVPDAVDDSGVRLWLSEAVEVEYGMMSPNTWQMQIPPGEQAEFTQRCSASMDFEILAGMPHMHEIGSTFVHDVRRADDSVDNLITLSGWSFETQPFYEMPMQVHAGDKLVMTCGYDNTTDQTVVAGAGTSDEMCFDFLVVTPAEAAFDCAF